MSLYPPLKSHWAGLCAAFAAAGAMLLGGAAAAQSSVDAPPSFPTALDRDILVAWLKRETDIPPDTVVAITPLALTSLMSTRVMVSPPGYSVALRAETLSAELFDRDGVLSWNTAIDVDCGKRRIRQGPTTGYASRNLLFTGKPVRPADRDWIAPPSGSTLENVWRAVCDKSFERPLASSVSAAVKPPVVAAEVAPPIRAPSRPAPAKAAAYPPIGASPTPATKIYPPAPAPAPPALRPAQTPTPATPTPVKPPAATPKPDAAPPPAPAVEEVEQARSTSTSSAAAQLSASGSQAEAEDSLTAVGRRYAEQMVGRTTRVARAVVKGKVYYRALVEGFSSAADAQGFCRSLNVTGQACFVRPNGLRD